VHIHYRQ